MGIFSAIKDKFVTTVMGDLITDLGTLPTDQFGREMSLSIRQRPGHKPHLQVRYGGRGDTHYFQIACSPEWADQFERVAQEIRSHANST
jgi:hypothetical protein